MGRKREKEWEGDFKWDKNESPVYDKLDLVSNFWPCDHCLGAQ